MARPAIPVATRRRVQSAEARLRELLPDSWTVKGRAVNSGAAQFELSAPNDERTFIDTYVVDRLEPRDVDRLRIPPSRDTMVVATWLSPRTRELLREQNASYVDLTGNVDLRLESPVAVIQLTGSDRDPAPRARRGPSLRGPKAWALLRTLVEVAPPYTAGDLAAALDLDDGYVSRALQVLVDERLVERRPRGPVTDVDWEALIRRIADSYSLLDANDTSMWIAAAGASQLIDDLADQRVGRWALTGSFVAASLAPVAAPEVAVIYTDDPERLANAVRLLPATTGANVILASPYNPIVFTRLSRSTDPPSVSVAQAALDLLTGPGRMPAEGDALVAWMGRNAPRWRASDLAA